MDALVTGAGGFIGSHLVKYLADKGQKVRGVDIKRPEYGETAADEFVVADLRELDNCRAAVDGVRDVYHLAADMGGIGYITSNFADLTVNNVWLGSKMLTASQGAKVRRFFFSSSACIYPGFMQDQPGVEGLKETDAIPADPEKGYGWEKLFTELLCSYFAEDHGMQTRVARFHNVFGPMGSYDGGKEKAPAAICRKVAMASDGSEIEVWGDGEQTRSFLYVSDCVEGIYALTQSDYDQPLNLGSDRLVTINELVDMVANVAGKRITKRHDLSKPQGVRGRNSDNSLLSRVLDWEERVSLEEGLGTTYKWIEQQVNGKAA